MDNKIYDPLTGQHYNPIMYELVSQIGDSLTRIRQEENALTYLHVNNEEKISNNSYNMSSKTYAAKVKRPNRKRRSKNKNKQQDARIKKLEQFIYPNIEYKSKDILATDVGISASGYANQPMMQLEQGDGSDQRIGDSVSLMQHGVTMTLRAQDSTNVVRVLWIVTPSTTALSISDVLEYGNHATYSNQVFSSPYKRKAPTAETTYRVLFDKVYKFGVDDKTICDKYVLKPYKNPKQLSFNSTAQVMPENYQLQILAISDSTAAGHPTISYVCRTKYYDL